MALTVLKITHANSIDAQMDQGDKYQAAQSLANLLQGLCAGAYKGISLDLQVEEGDAAAASATVTFADEGTANDTIIINGVTLTAVAGAPANNQWQVGADEVESAANLAAAINDSSTALIQLVTASDDGAGVVTVSAASKGTAGNAITIAEGVDAGNSMTVNHARLTGGADATANSFSFV